MNISKERQKNKERLRMCLQPEQQEKGEKSDFVEKQLTPSVQKPDKNSMARICPCLRAGDSH